MNIRIIVLIAQKQLHIFFYGVVLIACRGSTQSRVVSRQHLFQFSFTLGLRLIFRDRKKKLDHFDWVKQTSEP